VRGKIAEASVERKALIKANGKFIKEALPNTTLVNRMKRESYTLTVPDYTTPPPSYKTPINTRIKCPPIATSTLPPYETPTCTRFDATSDDDMGGVSEGDVHTFSTTSFVAVASPYLSPLLNRRGVLNIDYGLKKEGDRFL
jgi:hypothetical protein